MGQATGNWNRYTEWARRAIFRADEEAKEFGDTHVSTEHLLLGIVENPDNMAARVFQEMGATPEEIREEIHRERRTTFPGPSDTLTLTPFGKRALDLAADESALLGTGYIGTEHILLGLIRQREGCAGRALANRGLELLDGRKTVIELYALGMHEEPVAPAPVPYRFGSVAPDIVALLLLSEPSPELQARLSGLGVAEQLATALGDKVWSDSVLKASQLPSAADLFDSRSGSMAIFARIANHPGTLLHRTLREQGATVEAIEGAFPDHGH